MKILHILYTDKGGAALSCLHLHLALLKVKGVDSKVIVYQKTTDTPEVYRYGNRLRLLWSRLFSKTFEILGLRLTERSKFKEMYRIGKGFYTLPYSPIDLSKCKWVEWADIIHLHWVNWYLDYPSFFVKVKKPIVWTLHDENLFYGAAHYKRGVLEDNDMEKKLQIMKQKVIGPLQNISIVYCSEYMYNQYKTHPIVANKRQTIINNMVDETRFRPYDKNEMRIRYDIPQKKTVFVFSAANLFDPRKGLEVLVEALKSIFTTNEVIILAIGDNGNHILPEMVRSAGYVNSPDEMSKLLSCGDFFAMPSYQEAFALTSLEAMACGLPVVAFPCSGTSELINENNGIICSDFTVEALEEGIKQLMSKSYDAQAIRQDVISKYSPNVILEKYINCYRQVLPKSCLISVITVCYNSVNVIEKTILSVIRQTYQNVEYIVIDGNSQDGTIEVIKKYQDNIDYFLTEPDTGIYNAMNKGIRVAKGDYCLFMNAGDAFVNRDVLSEVVSFLTGESVISGNEIDVKNGKVEDYTKSPEELSFKFFCNNSLRHQATFIKTELLKSHPYDESLRIASDWKLSFEQLYINKKSYKPVDVDICLYARDGISTEDRLSVAEQERMMVICDNLGQDGLSRFIAIRKKRMFQYVLYRLNRRLMRECRLIKYRRHFEKVEFLKE